MPRKASKTFRSILSLLLMNDLGQIKNMDAQSCIHVVHKRLTFITYKPRTLFEM